MSTAGSRPRYGETALFLATGLGGLLASMDVSVANSLLRTIGADFGVDNRAVTSWVITSFSIAFAAVLVPAGRFADRAGRRLVYLMGLSVFLVGSLVCATARDLGILILGRVLQGIGGGALSPASMALLLNAVPEARRSVVGARWGGMGAIGIALGPLVGGLCTELISWRWAFLINVPLAIPALVLTPRVVAESSRQTGSRLPDPVAAGMFIVGAASFVLSVSEISYWGVQSKGVVLSSGVGLAASLLFIRRCIRSRDPLLDISMLKDRQLAGATGFMFLYSCAFFGALFSFLLYLTQVCHLTLLDAGLSVLPMPVIVLLLTIRVGQLANRVGFRLPIATGALIMCVGYVLSITFSSGAKFQPLWLVSSVVLGVGVGLCYPLLGAAAVVGLDFQHLASATSVNQTARQLGAAFGVASTVSVLGSGARLTIGDFHRAWLVCGVFALGACLLSGALNSREAIASNREPYAKSIAGTEKSNGELP